MERSALGSEHATIIPVILAGGAGTRLWPLSRPEFPKQFIPGLAERKTSLFGATLGRVAEEDLFAPPLILCNEAHAGLVAEELRRGGTGPATILVEPQAGNTAPALAAALHYLQRRGQTGILAMLPADHHVVDGAAFSRAMRAAAAAAAAAHLVLLGIPPAAPIAAYGYIRRGAPLDGVAGAFHVREFIEKPDADRAAALLAQGDCYWNSGIIVASVALLAGELARHAPQVWEAAGRALDAAQDNDSGLLLDPGAWAAAPQISADYALLEMTGRAGVCPAQFGWSDMGSWESLWAAPAYAAQGEGGGRTVTTSFGGVTVTRLSLDARAQATLGEARAGEAQYLVTEHPAVLSGEAEELPVPANEPVSLPPGRWRLKGPAPGPLRAILFKIRE